MTTNPSRPPRARSSRARQWTAGDVTSWVLGVTLGVLLGLALLVLTPRLLRGPAESTAPAAEASEAAPASGEQVAGTAQPEPDDLAASDSDADTTPVTDSSASSADTATSSPPAEGANAEAPAATDPSNDSSAEGAGTPASAGGDVAAGQAAYAGCAGCHGAQAQGGVGPALAGSAGWSDAEFLAALREGKTPTKTLGPIMPRFTSAQLSDADVVNIHAYVKSLN